MVVTASSSEEDPVSRWDGDGGSQPAPAVPARRDPRAFLRFVRLDTIADVREGAVEFPLGILWPYTADLRRVQAEFDAEGGAPTRPLLSAMATLYERIAFAPGRAGRNVADAYVEVKASLDAGALDGTPTKRCSRCRKEFPALAPPVRDQPEPWWLCPPCHDRLIGRGSKAGS